jgi:hypothetical protein
VTGNTTRSNAKASRLEDRSSAASVAITEAGVSASTPDPKITIGHTHHISIPGPFYPIGDLVKHLLRRCAQEGSLPALSVLKDLIENTGIVNLERIIAPLPDGRHRTIQVVREKNAQVAAFLRSYPPRSPRLSYTIFEHISALYYNAILPVPGAWPHEDEGEDEGEYVPVSEGMVFKTIDVNMI